MHFAFTFRTLNLDESQPCGDLAGGRQLGDVRRRRNPLHLTPSIGHRTARQRHSLDGRRRHDHHRVMHRQRVLRLTQVLDVGLRIRRIVLRETDQREIFLLPEIGLTHVDVVDGRALETGDVIALVQHVLVGRWRLPFTVYCSPFTLDGKR